MTDHEPQPRPKPGDRIETLDAAALSIAEDPYGHRRRSSGRNCSDYRCGSCATEGCDHHSVALTRIDRSVSELSTCLASIDYWLHHVSPYPLPDGIDALRVMPNRYPRTLIDADTYKDRTGLWGEGRDWLEYWASLGAYWVNLGIAADDHGPLINYKCQWFKGNLIQHLPVGLYPAFNFPRIVVERW